MSRIASSCREQAVLSEVLVIVRTALRDAMAAPSDRDSLDITGAALVAIAHRAQPRSLVAQLKG